ncbi:MULTISPECIES: hypothetical protein [unclassified Hyphomonas]|uniref:hypothetical protein n=1 Tax=unclassified Hyphomonas TaxID=2630699 RepID=UPI000458BE60|nr:MULTISPECIES: hypothetical protein [unclassified Hyphomonas]KCZ49901.1 hypothetical protein HY17_02015 [Hyphomonas sp. CY54-11-8]
MTEHQDNRPKKTRYRRPKAELDALRGESLASIRARLQIPESTLTGWARQDGYRQQDLKARAEAEAQKDAEAARGEGAGEIEAIRQQAGELWAMCEEMQDRPTTGARRQVDLARVLSFGRAGTGEMERFRNRAAVIVRQKGLERVMATARRINEEAGAARTAREAAGLPPLPPPEPKPWSKEEADAFYAELREKGGIMEQAHHIW